MATADQKAKLLAEAIRASEDSWTSGYLDADDLTDTVIDGHYNLIAAITEYERLLAELETTL